MSMPSMPGMAGTTAMAMANMPGMGGTTTMAMADMPGMGGTTAAAMNMAGMGGGGTSDVNFCVKDADGLGTTMQMAGFSWVSSNPKNACVTFLLQPLVVDSRGKMVAACIGVFVLVLTVELLMWLSSSLSPKRQKDLGVLLQTLTGLLMYCIMLLVMTYCVEFLLSAVLALMVANALKARLIKVPMEDDSETTTV